MELNYSLVEVELDFDFSCNSNPNPIFDEFIPFINYEIIKKYFI